MKYMLMMNVAKNDWQSFAAMTPEDLARHIQFMSTLNADLAASGELVQAVGLTLPGDARLVRADTDGAPVVTDGPFAETKEFLAGFWILTVASPERVHAIAARISAAPGAGGAPMNFPLEVRPVGEVPSC
jgi:hypothetical protein